MSNRLGSVFCMVADCRLDVRSLTKSKQNQWLKAQSRPGPLFGGTVFHAAPVTGCVAVLQHGVKWLHVFKSSPHNPGSTPPRASKSMQVWSSVIAAMVLAWSFGTVNSLTFCWSCTSDDSLLAFAQRAYIDAHKKQQVPFCRIMTYMQPSLMECMFQSHSFDSTCKVLAASHCHRLTFHDI
jgi:hypothetical protein